MGKGTATRAQVLSTGLDMASELGLEALSIGGLADRVGMSKSGLYAHFRSKEDLQCQVLDAGAERFIEEVMVPALSEPRGLPRLEAMQDKWMRWEVDVLPGGCPFVVAAVEYDDRDGPVRDTAVAHVTRMVEAVQRAAGIAVDEGHFAASLDTEAYAFQMWSIIVGYHHYARLMEHPRAQSLARAAFASLNSGAAA